MVRLQLLKGLVGLAPRIKKLRSFSLRFLRPCGLSLSGLFLEVSQLPLEIGRSSLCRLRVPLPRLGLGQEVGTGCFQFPAKAGHVLLPLPGLRLCRGKPSPEAIHLSLFQMKLLMRPPCPSLRLLQPMLCFLHTPRHLSFRVLPLP